MIILLFSSYSIICSSLRFIVQEHPKYHKHLSISFRERVLSYSQFLLERGLISLFRDSAVILEKIAQNFVALVIALRIGRASNSQAAEIAAPSVC